MLPIPETIQHPKDTLEDAHEAMLDAMDLVGNPSSVHAEGRKARSMMEKARAQVAASIGAGGDDIIFTSGATEAAALTAAATCRSRTGPVPPARAPAPAMAAVSAVRRRPATVLPAVRQYRLTCSRSSVAVAQSAGC